MNVIKLEPLKDIDSKIEDLVQELECDYIDAILEYCSRNDLDVEFIGEIISKSPILKSKVQIDAERLHFMKKTARLPLNN